MKNKSAMITIAGRPNVGKSTLTKGDGHVPKRNKARAGVLEFVPARGRRSGRQREHRKGEHIRRLVDLAVRVLEGIEDIAICRLTASDVVRHALVQKIVAAYDS